YPMNIELSNSCSREVGPSMLSAGFRRRFLGVLIISALMALGTTVLAQEKDKNDKAKETADADTQASPEGQTDPLKRPLSQKAKRQNAKSLHHELSKTDKDWLDKDVVWIITDEERK